MHTPTVKDAIDALRRRPRMFLKRDSVRDLNAFLTGYCFGLDVTRPHEFPHGNELQAFRRWLAERLVGREHEELENLLLTESDNDDDKAFWMFFDLWDEYCSQSDGV